METVRLLKERFPTLQDPPSDDICYATTNRQVAIKKISPQADLVIVVGSANSSNSVRLVEVALEYGAKASYRVDFANEVDESWFEGVATVGVTSGASVPEVLVQEVLRLLADYGYGTVEEVVTGVEETTCRSRCRQGTRWAAPGAGRYDVSRAPGRPGAGHVPPATLWA